MVGDAVFETLNIGSQPTLKLESLGLDTPLPQARQSGALVAFGQKFLYLGGGGMGPTSSYPGNDQCWSLQIDGTGEFNKYQWTPIAPIPTPVMLSTAATVQGKIYMVGGWSRTGSGDAYINIVQCYDPAADSWTTSSTAPGQPLAPIACAALGDKIYVVSGTTLAGGRDPPMIVQVYDPIANSWSNGPPLPASTYECKCVAIGTSLYVLAGGGDADYAYDTAAQSWSTMPRFPGRDEGVMGCAVVAYREQIVLLGGIQNFWSATDRSWAFNTTTGQWSELSQLNQARGFASAGVMGVNDQLGLVYLAGGVPSHVNTQPVGAVEAIGLGIF